MPSTYSTNLRLELIASGEQANTWGNTTNTNLGTLIESAISGYVSLTTMTDADYTLIALNGANDQARQMYLNVPNSAALTATRAIIAPSVPKVYVISNNSSGGQAVRIKTSGSTTTCLIPNGQTKTVVCDGTNFSEAVTAAAVLTLGANPTSALQATTKQYVDAADATKLNISGGTLTGPLELYASTPTGNIATSFNYVNTNYLYKSAGGPEQTINPYVHLNYTVPSGASYADVAINRTYVDSNFVGLNNVQTIAGTKTFSTNVSLSGSAQLILPNAPLTGTHATNKTYVDGVAASGQTYVDTYFALKSTQVIAGSGIQINGGGSGTLGSNLTISVVGGGTVTSVSATAPLQVSGSTAVTLSIPPATTSTAGYLSSTDWNTFNNKMANTAGAVVSALGSTPVGYATYATAPAAGGSFITSSNIASQTVAACTGNAATATAPQGGGTFITSSNIALQTVATAGACTGNAATATSPAGGGSFITSSNISLQSVSYANGALSASYLDGVYNSASFVKTSGISTISGTSDVYLNVTSSSNPYGSGATARIGSYYSLTAGYNLPFIGSHVSSGTKAPLVFVQFVGNTYTGIANFNSTGSFGVNNLANGSGATVQADSNGYLYVSSDANRKIDDGFIEDGLGLVSQLTPRYFYWKEYEDLPKIGDHRQLGFFAQEVNAVVPEAAGTPPEDNPNAWGINDRALVAVLTKAIQELNAKVEALTAEVNALKGV